MEWVHDNKKDFDWILCQRWLSVENDVWEATGIGEQPQRKAGVLGTSSLSLFVPALQNTCVLPWFSVLEERTSCVRRTNRQTKYCAYSMCINQQMIDQLFSVGLQMSVVSNDAGFARLISTTLLPSSLHHCFDQERMWQMVLQPRHPKLTGENMDSSKIALGKIQLFVPIRAELWNLWDLRRSWLNKWITFSPRHSTCH